MKNFPSFSSLEYFYTVICLFIYSGALLRLIASGGKASQNVQVQTDSGLIVAVFMATYVGFGLLVVLRWKQVLNTLRDDTIILPVLGMVFLSYFWSDSPALTLRRAIALLGTSMFGIYLASRYTIRQQLSLLAWSNFLIIVLSLLFVIALPSYGISHGLLDSAWRGVYAHKNGLGINMVISTLVFLLMAAGMDKHRQLFLVGALVSMFLLVMAQSGTALASLGVILAAFPIYSLIKIRSIFKLLPISILLLLCTFILVTLVHDNFAFSMELIGETPTLTNRTDIWAVTIEAINKRPILGYGYEVFWRGSGSDLNLIDAAGMSAGHAHNGLFQSWLHIGFIGVTLLVIGLWKNMLRAVFYFKEAKLPESYLPAGFFTLIILINVAESKLIDYNALSWVLYCSLTFSLALVFRNSRKNEMIN
ncbi:MAG: hypothetical protein GVY04_20155 [Cyanobacteria bacterium]|jgi:O-antigen ligase|nr:hypothetical protein [Cyanobacteria bacterium GSL.Bin1]